MKGEKDTKWLAGVRLGHPGEDKDESQRIGQTVGNYRHPEITAAQEIGRTEDESQDCGLEHTCQTPAEVSQTKDDRTANKGQCPLSLPSRKKRGQAIG